MLTYPAILGVSAAGLIFFLIVVYVATASIMSVLVVIGLIGVVIYILNLYGYLSISFQNNEVDIKFFESTPKPSTSDTTKAQALPLEKKEVFYISGNSYTYEDAPAVCAAYEADLATYDQIMEAYSGGAEWCGYGWTQGGMALYPTQQATWDALQGEVDVSKRTACGRPGVNGGYFDPSTKFGVNCYGVKPGDKGTKFPTPLPGSDPSAFNQAVDKFKSMINKMSVSPFNRDGWSEWNLSAHK
jgi:hypothetical protein